MFRILAISIVLTTAGYTSALASSCSEQIAPTMTAHNGLQVTLRSSGTERLADRVPLQLVLKNTTSTDTRVRYEPLNDTLQFDVFDSARHCLPPRDYTLGDTDIYMRGLLPANGEIDLKMNLTDWVALSMPGTYTVVARFRPGLKDVKSGTVEFVTAPLQISVIP